MENLIKQLRIEIDVMAGGKCTLWVDPAQRDPYDRIQFLKQRRVRVPISHVNFSGHCAPYLVPLDLAMPNDAALFNDSVELAWDAWTIPSLRAQVGQPVCGWIVTPSPAEILANHWGRHCHIHGHQYKSKLLRFHDPGVREWLWPTLNEAQRHSLLGPAACLFALGRNQCLLRHASKFTFSALAPFELNNQQWLQVGDYATVHAAWLECVAATGSASLNPPFSELALAAVLSALAQATRHGVTQQSERKLYARHALQLGTEFHADERMQKVWELTCGENYYGSVIEDVFNCAAEELYLKWRSSEEKLAWPT
jgi:hypothetical protein